MMFMAAFLLVVMATLLLRSGNVERNPGPTVIADSDWFDICCYLDKLDTNQITRLGGALGLNVFKLQKMKTLPYDMVTSWLRKEDDVKKKCGDPLTWEALVKALQTLGQKGIADEIFAQKCQPSGRPEPAPSVSAAPLEKRSEHSAGTVTQSSSSTSELPVHQNEDQPLIQGFKGHLNDAETESCKRRATMNVSELPAQEPAPSVSAAPLETRSEHTATVTQSSSSTSELPAQKNEDLPLTVEVHHAVLCEILKLHATKWREIGQQLGFLPGDLDNIQGAPLLLQTAPVSWMNAVLEKFLKEREGGAKMSVLEAALNKAGLGVTASQLRGDVQRLLAQAPSVSAVPLETRSEHSAGTVTQSSSSTSELPAQGVPKLNLSPVQKYAERLKELYSKRKMPDYRKGRQLRTARFVNLALISRKGVSKKEMDEFTRGTVQDGDIDAILMHKSPLEMKNIGKLRTGSLATCMLLQGGPGVGKTTLAWILCREWESGKLFQEYSLVVFVPLRRKDIREAKDIKQLFLIGNSHSKTQESISEELLNNQGESVLLVLDGYDELPEVAQQDSMIAELVSGQLLPKAGVLITSRPSACDKLTDKCRQRDEDFQHIEVLGFTKDKIDAYIEDNVDPKQLKPLKQYLLSHPKIYTSLYNPLQCAFTVEVCKKMFENGSGLPNTRTKLYETNVLMTMSREQPTLCRKTNILRNLPQALHENFVKLCRLAYDGIVKRQIIFEDVPEEIKKFGLLVCEPELDSVLPSSENYNFFHLTIQEFCAAYYICSLPEHEQQQLLKLQCQEEHFREVVIFLCGLSDNPVRIIDLLFSCVCQHSEDTDSIDTDSIDTDSIDTDSIDTDSIDTSQKDTLLLLHCAFESQCGDTCSTLGNKLNSSIDLSNQSLTPSDTSAVGYLMCAYPIKELDLNWCWCGDNGVEALINQFDRTLEEHSSLSIERIDLFDNNICADGAKFLSEGLKYCPQLQTLYLGGNNIDDDGAKCLSEGLEYCPKLQTLHVYGNLIFDEGRAALEMMSDEMNSKRRPGELKLSVRFY